MGFNLTKHILTEKQISINEELNGIKKEQDLLKAKQNLLNEELTAIKESNSINEELNTIKKHNSIEEQNSIKEYSQPYPYRCRCRCRCRSQSIDNMEDISDHKSFLVTEYISDHNISFGTRVFNFLSNPFNILKIGLICVVTILIIAFVDAYIEALKHCNGNVNYHHTQCLVKKYNKL